MPAQRFWNLPEEKRKRLMDSAWDEFDRAPFEELSINKIIQSASISRGSFYTYFEDKQDLLNYMLADFFRFVHQSMLKSLERSGGDLFVLAIDLFDFAVRYGGRHRRKQAAENIITYARQSGMWIEQRTTKCEGQLEEIALKLNADLLRSRSFGDLKCMLEMVFMITIGSLKDVVFEIRPAGLVRTELLRKLELVKQGFAAR